MATSTASSARKVLSSTRPVRTFFSLVRTNAPPLPGLTCWNSTTFIRSPSMFSVMPFFRSLVVGITALLRSAGRGRPAATSRRSGARPPTAREALWSRWSVRRGRRVGPPPGPRSGRRRSREGRHQAPRSRASLARSYHWHPPALWGPRGTHPHSGGLVDLQTDAMARGMAEGVAEAGPPEHHRPGHVRAVAVDARAEVELDQVAASQRAVAGPVMRLGRLLAEGHDRVEGQ